jgi:hypothetical protein
MVKILLLPNRAQSTGETAHKKVLFEKKIRIIRLAFKLAE